MDFSIFGLAVTRSKVLHAINIAIREHIEFCVYSPRKVK